MINLVPSQPRHYLRQHITSAVLLFIIVVTGLVLGCPYQNSAYSPPSPYEVYIEDIPLHLVSHADVDVSPTIEVRLHRGGERIPTTKLINTITSVADVLSTVPNDPYLYKLIYETAKVESELGSKIHSAGGLGMMQITLSTGTHFMNHIEKHNKSLYRELKTLYDSKLSLRDNLLYNVPFSIGLGMVIYCERARQDILLATSIQARACIWKQHYNTYKGVGTVDVYVKKNT